MFYILYHNNISRNIEKYNIFYTLCNIHISMIFIIKLMLIKKDLFGYYFSYKI